MDEASEVQVTKDSLPIGNSLTTYYVIHIEMFVYQIY